MLGGPLNHAPPLPPKPCHRVCGALSTPLCCNILKYALCYSPYSSYRATSHAGMFLNAHSIAYFIHRLSGQGKQD